MVDRNVTYRLRGDAGDFNRVVNRAEATLSGSFKKMQQASGRGGKAVARDYQSISRAADGAQLKVKGLVTAIGGFALGGGGLVALANNAIAAADEIGKTAQKLGLATDELQRYQFAAEVSGISTNEFNTAFQRLGRRLGEAAQGFGEARPALQSLGIAIRDVQGNLRPTNVVFDEAIQKLSQLEDVTLRNALAAKLFDSEGVKLVQLGENLARLKDQAGELGLIIPQELIENAEELSNQLTIVQKTLSVKMTAALVKFAPQLDRLANGALLVAENFDSIVGALADVAQLVVTVKLASMVQGLYGVAAASLAAAKGLNATRIALRGLKIASIVGVAFLAVEIAIEKLVDAVDDSGDSIEKSIQEAAEAYEQSTQDIADASGKITSQLIQDRQKYNKEIGKLVKEEIGALEDALKAQQDIVKDRRRSLQNATRDAQKAADEFKEAFAQIRGGNQENEDPNLIDFSKEITQARRLLDQGDNEGAVEAAIKAKDVVLALQETGKYTESQLSGTLKKALEVQQAASGAIEQQEADALAKAEQALQKIQSQINLIESISFSFDETKSLAEAKRVIDQIKDLVSKQPIVVPVTLKPTNNLGGSTEAPGFARGGYIQGPGTATSDSILARLSKGEYVLRAAAVKQYGLDFLNRLNTGRLPGFASGGLVQAPSGGSSGTPVNLNLGGRQYPMQASPQVAAQLRRETHMEQLKKGRRT
jgi:outer membrane protein OmpA-like peptidoglycan-associated protein